MLTKRLLCSNGDGHEGFLVARHQDREAHSLADHMLYLRHSKHREPPTEFVLFFRIRYQLNESPCQGNCGMISERLKVLSEGSYLMLSHTLRA